MWHYLWGTALRKRREVPGVEKRDQGLQADFKRSQNSFSAVLSLGFSSDQSALSAAGCLRGCAMGCGSSWPRQARWVAVESGDRRGEARSVPGEQAPAAGRELPLFVSCAKGSDRCVRLRLL